MRLMWIALIAACGRIGFDANGDSNGDGSIGDGDRDGAVGDGVPPGFCTAATDVGASGGADLAIARTHDGFLAMWGTAGVPSSVHADVGLSTFTAPQGVPALGGAINLNQILDEGAVYLVSTNDGAAKPSWWSLQYDLFQQSTASGTNGQPFCKDNIVSNQARSSFVYADANGTTIGMRYFFGNAFGTTPSNFTAAASVVGVAGADGPAHGHLAWATSTGTSSRDCYTGHITFGGNPMMSNATLVTSGCGSQLRAASGPAVGDTIAIAWTDMQGMVHAAHGGTRWDFGAGNGVRIKFDGAQFWVAWRGQTSGVHLAKLASDGTFTDYPLSALNPVSLEAMELVVDGSTVYVVSLEASQLVFVWPC